MPIKRMSHIRTAKNLMNRSQLATRPQMASTLARLEHEQARLQREHQLWLNKQRQAEERLLTVQQQIQNLQQRLLPDQNPANHGSGNNDDGLETPGWRKLSLEY